MDILWLTSCDLNILQIKSISFDFFDGCKLNDSTKNGSYIK